MTFRPLYDATCIRTDEFYYGDNNVRFNLHYDDHLRLLNAPFNEILSDYDAIISIGPNIVRTVGNTTGVTPVYFMERRLVNVYHSFSSYISSFHLDMVNAEFHIEFNGLVIASVNTVTLYCAGGAATLEGLWSRAESRNHSTALSMRMSPRSYAEVCSNLTCLEYGNVQLDYFSPFMDAFGSSITSAQYQGSHVR